MANDFQGGHLLVPFDGICWWCRERPADSREHKYKRTDLARVWSDEGLAWGDDSGASKQVRGIVRNNTVRFNKTLCSTCNNARSQPFDQAYDVFSEYLSSMTRTPMPLFGIDFQRVFGLRWQRPQMAVARYYGKHFGCRMAEDGAPIPPSLRAFLDGAATMPDAHLAIVANRSIRHDPRKRTGLSLSPDMVYTDRAFTRIREISMAAYVGHIGVRFNWREMGDWMEPPDSFFGHKQPVINRMLDHERFDNSWWATMRHAKRTGRNRPESI